MIELLVWMVGAWMVADLMEKKEKEDARKQHLPQLPEKPYECMWTKRRGRSSPPRDLPADCRWETAGEQIVRLLKGDW